MARFLYMCQLSPSMLELHAKHFPGPACLARVLARFSRQNRGRLPTLVCTALCLGAALLAGCGGQIIFNRGVSSGGPHEVDLSWTAPEGTDPIAGYVVFREDGNATTFQQLNTTLDNQTVYVDSNVQNALSYTYYVIAVDTSGNWSEPSNLVLLQVP